MVTKRWLRTVVPMGALFVGGLAFGVANADDAKPCASKTFKFKEVEAACKKGGQKAAKDLMKGVVKKAKKAGEEINCKSCHTDLKTYENKKSADADLKKWL